MEKTGLYVRFLCISGRIYKNEEAWEFVSKMMGGFKLGPDHPMWNMVGNFNMETLMGMNGAPDVACEMSAIVQ